MPAKTTNGPNLLPETTELATAANFAAVSTVLPDGELQNQLTWVHVEDGKLALNTETHRAKYLNVVHDPRITVLIRNEKDPYRYTEVRGRVLETHRRKPGTVPHPAAADLHRPETGHRRLSWARRRVRHRQERFDRCEPDGQPTDQPARVLLQVKTKTGRLPQ